MEGIRIKFVAGYDVHWYFDYKFYFGVDAITKYRNYIRRHVNDEDNFVFAVEVNHMKNQVLHRDNKPAYIDIATSESRIEYYQHSQIHRTNGPARIILKNKELDVLEYRQYVYGKCIFFNYNAPSLYYFHKNRVHMIWCDDFCNPKKYMCGHHIYEENFMYNKTVPNAQAFLKHKNIDIGFTISY